MFLSGLQSKVAGWVGSACWNAMLMPMVTWGIVGLLCRGCCYRLLRVWNMYLQVFNEVDLCGPSVRSRVSMFFWVHGIVFLSPIIPWSLYLFRNLLAVSVIYFEESLSSF